MFLLEMKSSYSQFIFGSCNDLRDYEAGVKDN